MFVGGRRPTRGAFDPRGDGVEAIDATITHSIPRSGASGGSGGCRSGGGCGAVAAKPPTGVREVITKLVEGYHHHKGDHKGVVEGIEKDLGLDKGEGDAAAVRAGVLGAATEALAAAKAAAADK